MTDLPCGYRQSRLGPVVCLGAALILLLGGDSYEAARSRIESMTKAERARLKVRYESFQQLSQAEQAEIRAIHTAVSQNSALLQTARTYREFLDVLPTYRREELRQETDPAKRLTLIRESLDDLNGTGQDPGGDVDDNRRRFNRLDTDELNAVMLAVSRGLEFTPDERKKFATMPTAARNAWIVSRAIQSVENRKPSAWAWLAKDADTIIAALPEDRRSRLESATQDEGQMRRALVLGFLIFDPLMQQWRDYLEGLVSEEDLEKYVTDTNDLKLLSELIRDPDNVRREMTAVYLRENPEKIGIPADDLTVLRDAARSMRQFPGDPRRGGFRRGDGPPGRPDFRFGRDRRDDDDRRPRPDRRGPRGGGSPPEN
ncbi:hypothetical protein [Stratiformator vulcanicus]|uniref:Uncharacterized protein n=1 Tax=Stratiformator vulcanicus TaxID=2527980 RepID=A0A517R435_9PLAN|nr:hypothetical protein [Stratiformator vulcanicus]QDT38649.1 hypothetical protein Pan189_30440 [Stratiformator vulcanicus]